MDTAADKLDSARHVGRRGARRQVQPTSSQPAAEVKKGQTTSQVRIDIGAGVVITASITNEAVDDLKLAKGQKATAIIKATSVMVAVD